jgi:hypothetical protein
MAIGIEQRAYTKATVSLFFVHRTVGARDDVGSWGQSYRSRRFAYARR